MGKHRPLCSGARYGWMMIEQKSAGFIEEASPHIPRHHHQLAICVICTGHMHITCYILLLITHWPHTLHYMSGGDAEKSDFQRGLPGISVSSGSTDA